MGNTLGNAVSGLISLQRSIATASHNIVNVNTEGYSRQKVDMVSQPATRTGAGYIGNGVKTGGIRRIYSEFLVSQVRDYASTANKLDVQTELSLRLDNMLADPEAGLAQNLQNLFGALHNVANSPASITERQVAISEANALARQVKFLDSGLSDLNGEVNSRLGPVVGEINTLAENIARTNERISSLGEISLGQTPNDLYDLRDQLLADLSAKVAIRTIEQDGSLNVLVGNGQPLVVGGQRTELTVMTNAREANRTEIGLVNSTASATQVTSLISGGELHGLISFRDELLNPARNQLGLVVVGLVETFNAQHELGVDSKGMAGQAFFKSAQPAVRPDANNAGVASVNVGIADVGQLHASDYLLRYDGASWQVIRNSDGTSTTGVPPLAVDGLSIDIVGAAAAGDSFLIRPTFEASAGFDVGITQPSKIAAAGALNTTASISNTGDATLTGLDVGDRTGLPVAAPITLTFDADAMGPGLPGFIVTGGPVAAIPYDPAVDGQGRSFSFPSVGNLVFTMSGNPATGDQFTIDNNTSGVGDNRNVAPK